MPRPIYYDRELSNEEILRHAEKKRKQKAARNRMLDKKTTFSKGLIMVNTGKGKGKTTSAMGLVLRFLGNDKKVAIVQFIKGAWDTGERKVLESFSENLEIHTMGEGFTWDVQDLERDIKASTKAWEKAEELIASDKFDLIVCDEINISLRQGYLDPKKVVSAITNKPEMLTVMLTGRNALDEIIEVADTVTDMQDVKHHFRANIRAQKGIEY